MQARRYVGTGESEDGSKILNGLREKLPLIESQIQNLKIHHNFLHGPSD